MVLYCANDLIWATRIKATAESLGIPCRPARNAGMLRDRLEDSDVRGVILDLEAAAASFEILEALRGADAPEKARAIRIVAFGPHVAVADLEAARAGGADKVLARGAFDRNLPEILRSLEEGVA